MAQIITSVFNAFKRTAGRVIRNMNSGTVDEIVNEEETGSPGAPSDLHRRLEGLLEKAESDGDVQIDERETPPDVAETDTSAPLKIHEGGITEIRGKEAHGEFRKIQMPETGSGVAHPAAETVASGGNEAESATRAVKKTGARKTTVTYDDRLRTKEVEVLRKEVETIEKAIVEHIECTVKRTSGDREESVEKLIKKWGQPWKATPEIQDT